MKPSFPSIAAAPSRGALLHALREAGVTMLAALLALACAVALAHDAGAAVLAVVLSLSLSRSELDRDWRHRLEAALALPVVGVAAIGVGWLLRHSPWLGAALFVAGMFVSIWLRRFGATARRMGSLVALPFVTLLVVPHAAASPNAVVPHAALPILVALLALFWVSALHALARRVGFLPRRASRPPAAQVARGGAGAMKPDATTRMAIQMAVALAIAFVVGFAFFAQRWAWIVLTAFIVLSGNRGRLDVAWKSVLRIGGAALGTAFALFASTHAGGHDATTLALILAAVFLGVWLRPIGYAWWALFVTIALALLQGFDSEPAARMLALRLEEIVIGAVIGLATAWWLLPVRSTGVLRRRIADALAALGAALDPASEQRNARAFVEACAAVEQIAPAFRAARAVTLRAPARQPADWIDALAASRDAAVALIESGATPADVRRAVGAARKALLDVATLTPALAALRDALVEASTRRQAAIVRPPPPPAGP